MTHRLFRLRTLLADGERLYKFTSYKLISTKYNSWRERERWEGGGSKSTLSSLCTLQEKYYEILGQLTLLFENSVLLFKHTSGEVSVKNDDS